MALGICEVCCRESFETWKDGRVRDGGIFFDAGIFFAGSRSRIITRSCRVLTATLFDSRNGWVFQLRDKSSRRARFGVSVDIAANTIEGDGSKGIG